MNCPKQPSGGLNPPFFVAWTQDGTLVSTMGPAAHLQANFMINPEDMKQERPAHLDAGQNPLISMHNAHTRDEQGLMQASRRWNAQFEAPHVMRSSAARTPQCSETESSSSVMGPKGHAPAFPEAHLSSLPAADSLQRAGSHQPQTVHDALFHVAASSSQQNLSQATAALAGAAAHSSDHAPRRDANRHSDVLPTLWGKENTPVCAETSRYLRLENAELSRCDATCRSNSGNSNSGSSCSQPETTNPHFPKQRAATHNREHKFHEPAGAKTANLSELVYLEPAKGYHRLSDSSGFLTTHARQHSDICAQEHLSRMCEAPKHGAATSWRSSESTQSSISPASVTLPHFPAIFTLVAHHHIGMGESGIKNDESTGNLPSSLAGGANTHTSAINSIHTDENVAVLQNIESSTTTLRQQGGQESKAGYHACSHATTGLTSHINNSQVVHAHSDLRPNITCSTDMEQARHAHDDAPTRDSDTENMASGRPVQDIMSELNAAAQQQMDHQLSNSSISVYSANSCTVAPTHHSSPDDIHIRRTQSPGTNSHVGTSTTTAAFSSSRNNATVLAPDECSTQVKHTLTTIENDNNQSDHQQHWFGFCARIYSYNTAVWFFKLALITGIVLALVLGGEIEFSLHIFLLCCARACAREHLYVHLCMMNVCISICVYSRTCKI